MVGAVGVRRRLHLVRHEGGAVRCVSVADGQARVHRVGDGRIRVPVPAHPGHGGLRVQQAVGPPRSRLPRVERLHASRPTRSATSRVWNGFTTCWFSAGPARPHLRPGDPDQPADRGGGGDHRHRARAVRGARAGADEAAAPGPVRHPGVPDPRRARDRDRGGLADLLRSGRNYFRSFPALGRWTILLGQVVFNASLAMLIIRARFVGMGDTLEEAAYDLGSGPLSPRSAR